MTHLFNLDIRSRNTAAARHMLKFYFIPGVQHMADSNAISRAAKTLLILAMTATFASGCYFDVSTTGNASGRRSAEELAGLMVTQFANQTGGVTAKIACPTGLSGQPGSQLTRTGTTSDGYTLTIVVLEREAGAFRWDIIDSVPVTQINRRT
jgi:hypothetical protein